MSDPKVPDERWLDEQLAEFTDRLLAAEPDLQPSASDAELRALQEMVVRLKRLLADPQADPQTVERLRVRILAAWQHQQGAAPASGGPRRSFVERLKTWLPSSAGRRSRLALGLSLVTLAVIGLLLAVFLPAPVPSGWSGTAAGGGAVWQLAVLAGLLFLVGLFWLWRSRR